LIAWEAFYSVKNIENSKKKIENSIKQATKEDFSQKNTVFMQV